MRHRAVFDPFAGIAGDMILGAWVDLGLDADWLAEIAEALELKAEIRIDRVERAGISASQVTIEPCSAPDGHGRHLSEIRELIERSALAEEAKRLALAAFARLGEAEGRVHGVPAESVHLHEVGAVDAILDICGAADGFLRLEISDATTRPVTVGQGFVEIAHGTYPTPAPATAYLLEGLPMRPRQLPYECTTPTGAALLATFTGGRSPEGTARLRAVGYGAGTRDTEGHPNCLRVWLEDPPAESQDLLLLQSDIDDMSPEYVPDLIEACLAAGANDAVVLALNMKKGRAGWRLEALVERGARDAVEEAIFRASTTIGIRGWAVSRRTLARSVERRDWRGHTIRVKRVRDPSGRERAKPEHDDVAAAAAAEGVSAVEALRELRNHWGDLV